MSSSAASDVITFEEGWPPIHAAIQKLISTLDSGLSLTTDASTFTASEYSHVYTTCYNMCVQRSSHNYSEQLYQKHTSTIHDYLEHHTLPTLLPLSGDELIAMVITKWRQFQLMDKWMHKFFMYLDRYHVKQKCVPTLQEASLREFRETIYQRIKTPFVRAVLETVNRERDGGMIDSEMFLAAVNLFVSLSFKSPADQVRGSDREALAYPVWRDPGAAPNGAAQQIYATDFESAYLAETRKYFSSKASIWVSTHSTGEYLQQVNAVLESERGRVNKYFQNATEAAFRAQNPGVNLAGEEALERVAAEQGTLGKVESVLNDVLLVQYEHALLVESSGGLEFMLENGRREELGLVFKLYRPIEAGLEPVAAGLKMFVKKEGKGIKQVLMAGNNGSRKGKMKAEEVDRLVRSYVDLHDKYQDMVKAEFSNHPLFSKSLKEAFEAFLNDDDLAEQSEEDAASAVTFAELLATFIDVLLKNNKINEANKEELLDKSVALFEYLHEKDRFNEIYRNQLAKRLLTSGAGSASGTDVESAMIGRLKNSVGAGYTSKMEGMVKDLLMGREQSVKFKSYCNVGESEVVRVPVGEGSYEFTTQLLTSGWWPNYADMELEYPEDMKVAVDKYEEFYAATNSDKRKLKWMHALGSVEVKMKLNTGKPVEMTVTSLQAAALMVFNNDKGEDERLNVKEICKRLGGNIDENFVKKVLHSFLRVGVLKKVGEGSINKIDVENDEFEVNADLQVKKNKFKVPMPSLEENHNPKKVQEDRSQAIDASIVRIMKARKTLQHNSLVGEVMQQLQTFKPAGKQIKQRIEGLIEKEYLERDEKDRNKYIYLS